MSLNPFATTKDYSEMLNKIAFFNFFSGLLILYLLGKYVPEISLFLNKFKWNIELIGKSFSIINVAVPFLIAIFSRIIKLHDRISDIFRIRIRYDLSMILKPIAKRIDFKHADLEKILKRNREHLMSKCFYKYASTQESKCQIEYHNVIMAIDQLSWYWTVIEIIVLTLIGLIISLYFNNNILIYSFMFSLIILIIISFIVLHYCRKYTKIEVEQILEDSKRIGEIIETFHAL